MEERTYGGMTLRQCACDMDLTVRALAVRIEQLEAVAVVVLEAHPLLYGAIVVAYNHGQWGDAAEAAWLKIGDALRTTGYIGDATGGCYEGNPHVWDPAYRCTRCGMSAYDLEDAP